MLKTSTARRLAMRDAACHGDRLTAARTLEAIDDSIGCTITRDLLISDEQVAPLDPLPCPVTLAWAENDAFFPAVTYGKMARERLPQATYKVRPQGHPSG
jgi:pimeloyl-ACP methyl ester carboxylesterase